jgi:ADP-ribose pyrophosphatase
VHGLAHEGEDIRVFPIPVDEALALVDRGVINSAWPIIALQWLARHRERLRAAWS